MFALREIITGKLYALAGEGDSDVFTQCFEQWQDITFLQDFFFQHHEGLSYYGLGRKETIKKIIKEAARFENALLDIAHSDTDEIWLDSLFAPLHLDDDFETPYLQSRAYGNEHRPSFLRLYGIRLSDGCYIIVAGLIKTTRALQQSEEGKAVLLKLKAVVNFLKENHFEDSYNIAEIIL